MAIKTVDYWSPSQLGQFDYCPVSYKYLYIDGIPRPEFGNIYTAYGQAIHAALELNYAQKITSRVDMPIGDVFDKFREVFDQALSKLKYFDYALKEAFIQIASSVLTKYLQEIAPSIQPLLVEHRFNLKLKNYPIIIHGIIDLVDDTGLIRDYKTCGKTYKKDWNQKSVDNNFQLTWYAAAYRKIFLKPETGVCIDLLPREYNPTFTSIRSTRSDEQVHKALSLASAIEKIVDFGVFLPKESSCPSCPFNTVCPKLPVIVR